MKIKVAFVLILITFFCLNAYPYSARHHVINMGKNLKDAALSPIKGLFITGPKNIQEAYQYEVWEREKQEKRGLLRYKLFALWRVPGEETKGIIDGLTNCVKHSGIFLKEFLSIFFSD